MPADNTTLTKASPRVVLRMGGVDWQGWKSVSITRAVDNLAGGFALGLSDRWQYGQEAVPLAAGMPCELLLQDMPLITGHVDKVSHSLSATEGSGQHGISVEGRDRSADMVDSAAVHSPGQWKNVAVDHLARILGQPFGVGVTVESAVGAPFHSFQLQPGEKAFDALKRALKQRELLALPDGKGNVVLAKVGAKTVATALVQGKNLLRMEASFDASQRHSHYIVLGQKQGNDKEFGAACSVRGNVQDEEITRHRPMILRAAQQGDAGHMRKRALWERTTRRAKGTVVRVTVQGWCTDNGQLWPVGHLVPVRLPYMGIDQPLLIARTTFKLDGGGSTTELELKDKDAYTPEPEKPKGAEGGTGDMSLFVQQSRKAHASGEELKGAL